MHCGLYMGIVMREIHYRLFFLALLTLGFTCSANAQGIYIGAEENKPSASSLLEVDSDSMGFLFPRMTAIQMEAISTPAEGLMVYNTTGSILSYYNGTEWFGVDGNPSLLELGDLFQGGKVFWLDGTGRHGLIADTSDLVVTAWGCEGTDIIGANSDTDGITNTDSIVSQCTADTIAAKYCLDHSVVDGGNTYDDWYLPAVAELDTLIAQRALFGNFNGTFYWSSTEAGNINRARGFRSSDWTEGVRAKDVAWSVRPIRKF